VINRQGDVNACKVIPPVMELSRILVKGTKLVVITSHASEEGIVHIITSITLPRELSDMLLSLVYNEKYLFCY
jgi:hypothetical protein